jgi:hypothetical protein
MHRAFYLTPQQDKQLARLASNAGLSISAFVRSRLFDEDPINAYRFTGNGSLKRRKEIRDERKAMKILSKLNH